MTEAKRNERTSATALLAVKTAFGHAQTALAQAQARRDQVWERCAEEQIDIEQIAVAPADGDDALASPTLQTRIEQTCAKLPRMGTINPLAPQEYAEMHERYTFLTIQAGHVQSPFDAPKRSRILKCLAAT